jgi:hypothetical protein
VGSDEGGGGSSRPRGLERRPPPKIDPGRKSYLRRSRAELEEQKWLPNSNNQRNKRASTSQRDESTKVWRSQPVDLTPPYELTSAFRQSERLNEERILKDQVSSKQTVACDGARPDTNYANNPKGQATIELPTTRAGVHRSDPGAEEDAAAAKASTQRAVVFDKARPEKHHATKPEGNEPPTMLARVRRPEVEADKEDEVADKADTDKVTKVADQRNLKRVDKADDLDLNLLTGSPSRL